MEANDQDYTEDVLNRNTAERLYKDHNGTTTEKVKCSRVRRPPSNKFDCSRFQDYAQNHYQEDRGESRRVY